MDVNEFIKRATEKHGERYLYDKVKYVNADVKVEIICKEHGVFKQLPYAHLNGQGCPKCAGRGLSQDEIIEKFRSVHGDKYDYSKVVFKKMRDKVCIICPEHGEFWQTPDKHYRYKQGCWHCAIKQRAKTQSATLETFLKRAKTIHGDKYGYEKVKIENIRSKITIICQKHGEFIQTVFSHLNGHGCPKCAIEKTRITKDNFIIRANIIHNNKYDYSESDVKNTKNKIKIVCPEHGEFLQTADTHLKGCGCPRCGRVESEAERFLYDYVCGLVGEENVIHNDRSVLNGKEIDIYVPSLNIGFEYNGVIWHSEKFGKDKRYHLGKLEDAEKKGVQLYQIFEDEFIEHKLVVLSKIKYILGGNIKKNRIYARNCNIETIDNQAAKRFLENNHIQGHSNSSIYLGLKTKKENLLVGVMSFLKQGDNKYLLSRFATDNNYVICGGGGKLFKHFIKGYNPNEVITFADRRWTKKREDNLYTKIGFKFDKVLSPEYRYVFGSDGKRHHKFNFRKKHLSKKFNLPMTMTESEMAQEIGAYKIWDCGLFRFKWLKEKCTHF